MVFSVVRARRGLLRRSQWFGRVVAANGREVFRTSETYANPEDVVTAFWALVQDGVPAYKRVEAAVAAGEHLR